jgi:hypothetical protein
MRFADTRQHRHPAAEPIRTPVTLDRRITLYGSGINPGHVRLHPGDVATLVKDHGLWTMEWADQDGVIYTSTIPALE